MERPDFFNVQTGKITVWPARLAGPYWAGWAVHYARAVPAPLPEDDDDAISIVELLAQK